MSQSPPLYTTNATWCNSFSYDRLGCNLYTGNVLQENIDAKHQWRPKSLVSEILHIIAGYILNIRIE